MDETFTTRSGGALRGSPRKMRPDYKARLSQTRAALFPDMTAAPEARCRPAAQIQALAEQAEARRTAFQGVVAAALRALDEAAFYERRAAEAVLSLAQRQKLQHLLDEADATRHALGQLLTPGGAAMLDLPEALPQQTESSWGLALSEALPILAEGASAMRGLAASQPTGSATRTLSDVVARLLHRHHRALAAEAERWRG